MTRIVERIPHNTVSYAYLELEAENANEFESLREEALKKIPQYAFALAAPSAPKVVEAAEAEPAEAQAAQAAADVEVQATEADAAPTKAPVTEGLSPREKAKLRMQQKGAA